MSRKWAQTILPGLWPRLVRLGWHIIHNSATQPEVTDASPSLKQTIQHLLARKYQHTSHQQLTGIKMVVKVSRLQHQDLVKFRTWYICLINRIVFSVETILFCLLHSECLLPEMSVSGNLTWCWTLALASPVQYVGMNSVVNLQWLSNVQLLRRPGTQFDQSYYHNLLLIIREEVAVKRKSCRI